MRRRLGDLLDCLGELRVDAICDRGRDSPTEDVGQQPRDPAEGYVDGDEQDGGGHSVPF